MQQETHERIKMPTWPSRASFSPAHRITADDLRADRERRQRSASRERLQAGKALLAGLAADKGALNLEVQTRLEKKVQLAKAQRNQMEARQKRLKHELAALKIVKPTATSLRMSSVERSARSTGRAPGRQLSTEGVEYDYKTEGPKRVFLEKHDSSNVDFTVASPVRSPNRAPAPPPYALLGSEGTTTKVGKKIVAAPVREELQRRQGRARSLDRSHSPVSNITVTAWKQERIAANERQKQTEKTAAENERKKLQHDERCEQWRERQKKMLLKAQLDEQLSHKSEERHRERAAASRERSQQYYPQGLGMRTDGWGQPSARRTGRASWRGEQDALAAMKPAPRGKKQVAHTEYSPERLHPRSKSAQSHVQHNFTFQDVERQVPVVGRSTKRSHSEAMSPMSGRRFMMQIAHKDTRLW